MSKIKMIKPKTGPCPTHVKLEEEKVRLTDNIKLLSSHGLQTPIALEKLVKVSNRLSDCVNCSGGCRE